MPRNPMTATEYWTARCRRLPILLAALLTAGSALAQNRCGPLENGYGPYDYVTERHQLPIVEGAHFTPEVETGVRGKTSIGAGGDLDYTLRASPNHHRALLAAVQYAEKLRTDQPFGMRYTIECYFDRALRFRPRDTMARMIYAEYLINKQRHNDADRQLAAISELAKGDGTLQMTVGLLYLDMKAYDKALAHEHAAAALQQDTTELREALRRAGKWTAAPAPSTTVPERNGAAAPAPALTPSQPAN